MVKGKYRNPKFEPGDLVLLEAGKERPSRKPGYGVVLDHSDHKLFPLGISREGKSIGDGQKEPAWVQGLYTLVTRLPDVITM